MNDEIATEAGHWYAKDGAPVYTLIGKNGNHRNTTLRDARKLGLVPSVTTIIRVADKPALTRWLVDQAYLACLTLPRIEGEGLDAFKARAKIDANAQAELARDTGTAIHGSLEKAFQGLPFDEGHRLHADAVFEVLKPHRGSGWHAERSFACPDGYGGKVDLYSDCAVIDYKCKAFTDPEASLAWPEQEMQLSSYRHGLNLPSAKRINVFVSTAVPGLVVLHEWPDQAEDVALIKFLHLLGYWKADKGYQP